MIACEVNKGLCRLMPHIPAKLPPTGWFFADTLPATAIVPDRNKWTCMFRYIENVGNGKQICFSSRRCGCSGASRYFGFTSPSARAGHFLAEKEHFKKNVALGDAFYHNIQARRPKNHYLIWEAIAHMDPQTPVEVITIWTNGAGLAGLVTLANYDRMTNENVLIPFASGCQSIWTIPYKEKFMDMQRAVVGGIDPAMRHHLASDTISFSVSAERFIEMAENISGSFLENRT